MRMVMAGVIKLRHFWYHFFGAKQRPAKCGVHHFGHVLQLYPHISTDFRPRVSHMAYIGAAGKPKKLAEGDVNKFIEKTQAHCVQRLIFLIQIAIWGHTQFSETPKHHLSTGEIW